MEDKEFILCVHCVDQYLLKNLNGKKIIKEQCIKCYNDQVSFSLTIIHRDV